MALKLKTPPPAADSPYTKVDSLSSVADKIREKNGRRSGKLVGRIYPKETNVTTEAHRMSIVSRAISRPLGLSSREAGRAIAEGILADITARHTISEGGSKKFLDVKKQLAAVGMHIHKTAADSGDDNEVRVVPHKDRHNKELGYFTDDLDDALHSGLHIAKHMGLSEERKPARMWVSHARDIEGNTLAYGYARHANPSIVSRNLYRNMTNQERDAWHSTETDIHGDSDDLNGTVGFTQKNPSLVARDIPNTPPNGGRQIVGNGFVRPRASSKRVAKSTDVDESLSHSRLK